MDDLPEREGLFGRMNNVITFAMAALILASFFFIYSACYVSEDVDMKWYEYKHVKQMIWVCLGGLLYVWIAFSDYHSLKSFAVPFFLLSLVLLGLIFVFGVEVWGARRWLDVGPIRVQPSEFAKLASILLLAYRMSWAEYDNDSLKEFIINIIIVMVPFVLIVMQPDAGTALIFLPLVCMMMFVAGTRMKYLATLAGIGVAAVVLILMIVLVPEKIDIKDGTRAKIKKVTLMKDYHRERILVFLGIKSDPLKSGYNKNQSLIAVGSGGMFGKGYLKGTQNILGFLPKTITPTDFIYSVIAEEHGFMGSIVIITLYGILLSAVIYVMVNTSDKFGMLLCAGVITLLFCHIFINIAMTVGLLPIVGIPLPFLSYGGSFMLVNMIGMGIVQSVYMRSRRPAEY